MSPTPAERLLGVRVTATDDGGCHLTVTSRTPDGDLVQTDYVAEPYVADMLRRAVTHGIPDRPHIPADAAEIQRRLESIAA